MKGKVFLTGLMVLLSLSLLSCGGGTSGGGSGAPGSQSDDTGIQIQSVGLAPASGGSSDIDVFSNPAGCGGSTSAEPALTDALVTMTINSVAYNPDTNFSPFPANLTECFVSYTSAVVGAPIIEAETIYSPNCTFNGGVETACDLDLLNIARKIQWWADISPVGSGKFVPAEYPTRYTVTYLCNFKNQFGQTGQLGGKIDVDLADWCSQ